MRVRQASIVTLFICLAFVYRMADAWPNVPSRMLVSAGVLLVFGLGGLVLGKAVDSLTPKSLLDYLVIAMAVVGGNLLYRVIDGLPVVTPSRAIAAGVLVTGSFVAAMIGARRS